MFEYIDVKCSKCGVTYQIVVVPETKEPLGKFICPDCGTAYSK